MDELLKKINCASINSPQTESAPHLSIGGGASMMNPFGASAMGGGAFVSVAGRTGPTAMQQGMGEDSMTYNNFSRMMANVVNTDFYGQGMLNF